MAAKGMAATDDRPYRFVKEDGAVLAMPFSAVMEQDAAGYITLADGAVARRARQLERLDASHEGPTTRERTAKRGHTSQTLGFYAKEIKKFQKDLTASGIGGIEFVPNASDPRVIDVKADSVQAMDRYAAHRAFVDDNTHAGAAISADSLQRAEAWARERYPQPPT